MVQTTLLRNELARSVDFGVLSSHRRRARLAAYLPRLRNAPRSRALPDRLHGRVQAHRPGRCECPPFASRREIALVRFQTAADGLESVDSLGDAPAHSVHRGQGRAASERYLRQGRDLGVLLQWSPKVRSQSLSDKSVRVARPLPASLAGRSAQELASLALDRLVQQRLHRLCHAPRRCSLSTSSTLSIAVGCSS